MTARNAVALGVTAEQAGEDFAKLRATARTWAGVIPAA